MHQMQQELDTVLYIHIAPTPLPEPVDRAGDFLSQCSRADSSFTNGSERNLWKTVFSSRITKQVYNIVLQAQLRRKSINIAET